MESEQAVTELLPSADAGSSLDSLVEQAIEFLLLCEIQSGGPNGMRFGHQAVGVTDACKFKRAKDGPFVNAEDAGAVYGTISRKDGPHCLAVPLLLIADSSVRSAHASFCVRNQAGMTLPAQLPIAPHGRMRWKEI